MRNVFQRDTAKPSMAITEHSMPRSSSSDLIPIGTLAQSAGVSTRTVRYYEEIGLLPIAKRFAGGRRVFSNEALQRLQFISRLKTLGFSLDEIRHLNDVFEVDRSTKDMLIALDELLGGHLATLEQRLQELQTLKTEIGTYRSHIQKRLHRVTSLETKE